MKFNIITKSENETMRMAKAIASFFNCGDLLLLDGDLGTGKTYFVKGFAEGIGSTDKVTSPTFSIANFYNAERSQLLHIDLYRIADIAEFNELGLSEYFPETIVIIEWGTKFPDFFDEYMVISIKYIENEKDMREISFSYKGEKYNSIIPQFYQELTQLFQC